MSLSHVGVCVSDLERSVRFYRDGLGFEAAHTHRIGTEFGRLMEIDGVALESRFLRRDGMTIELLHFEAPGHLGDGQRRAINRLGLTHLAMRVDDVDEVAAHIVAFGGQVVTGTRTTFDLAGTSLDFLYCTDPDGVRIELMRLPDPEGGH